MSRDNSVKNSDKIHQVAYDLALRHAPMASPGAWGLIRKELFRDVLVAGRRDSRVVFPSVQGSQERHTSRL